jgi:4Fe-4S ferredoxin
MTDTDLYLPIIDFDRCDGCGACVQVCPTGALEMLAGLAVLVAPDACGYCADCEEHCPQGAIALPYEIVLD